MKQPRFWILALAGSLVAATHAAHGADASPASLSRAKDAPAGATQQAEPANPARGTVARDGAAEPLLKVHWQAVAARDRGASGSP